MAGNLERLNSYERGLSGTPTVFHLAAARTAPGTPSAMLRRINVEAARELGRAAIAAQVRRFVYVSSATVFGPSGERPLAENDGYCPLALATTYVRSRVEGLEAMKRLGGEGLPLVTVCPAIVFGPDRPTHPNRVTTHLRRLLRSRTDLVIGGGRQRRTLVFVKDVVRGLLLAERVGRIGEEYILGAEDLSHDELNGIARSFTGRPARLNLSVPVWVALAAARAIDTVRRHERETGYEASVRMLTREWRYSSEKAERVLGYTATPVRDGIRETLRALGREAHGDGPDAG